MILFVLFLYGIGSKNKENNDLFNDESDTIVKKCKKLKIVDYKFEIMDMDKNVPIVLNYDPGASDYFIRYVDEIATCQHFNDSIILCPTPVNITGAILFAISTDKIEWTKWNVIVHSFTLEIDKSVLMTNVAAIFMGIAYPCYLIRILYKLYRTFFMSDMHKKVALIQQ